MIHAWTTPIYTNNINEFIKTSLQQNPNTFHRQLSGFVKEMFKEFEKSIDNMETPHSGAHTYGTNQLFYDW